MPEDKKNEDLIDVGETVGAEIDLDDKLQINNEKHNFVKGISVH